VIDCLPVYDSGRLMQMEKAKNRGYGFMRNLLFCFLAVVFISAAGESFENLNIAADGKISVGSGGMGFSVVNSG